MRPRLWLTAAAVAALAAATTVLLLRRPHATSRAPRPRTGLAGLPWRDQPLDWTRPLGAAPGQLSAPEGYVGAAACAVCHGEVAKSYQAHAMATTGLRELATLDPAWLARIFDGAPAVPHPSGYRYRPLREGTAYFVEETLAAPDGRELSVTRQPITLALSSGRYAMAFAFRAAGRVRQVPIDYFTEAGRWGLDPGFRVPEHHATQPIQAFCVSCHGDPARHLAASEDALTDPLPAGIGCERCHGPGQRHARSGLAADIVNPARLAPARQLAICAQCHLNGQILQRAGRGLASFHPGEALSDWRMNYLAEPARPDELELIGQVERLVRSPCYRGSEGRMTCTTCHAPHESSASAAPGRWREKCLGCHQLTSCREQPAVRAANGDDCVRCHMRRSGTTDVPAIRMTDHWIQRRPAPPLAPDAEPSLRQPAALRPFASLVGETPTGPDLALLAAAALADAGRLDLALPGLASGLASHPETPQAYLIVGRLADDMGEFPAAAQAFASVLRFAPDSREALLGYAESELTLRRPEPEAAAERAVARLLALDPDDVEALELGGIVALVRGDAATATDRLERATGALPSARSEIGLAALAIHDRDWNRALPHLEAARHLAPGDDFVARRLPEAYRALGRAAEADRLARAPEPPHDDEASRWLPKELR